MADAQTSKPRSLLSQTWMVASKDLAIEWRSREIIYTMAFMAALIVLIFAFAFISGAESGLEDATRESLKNNQVTILVTFGPGVTAGVLWVAILFSGTVALGRTFDRERDGEAIRSLLMSPLPRSAIYLGKLLAVVVLMVLVESLTVALCALFFDAAPLLRHPGRLAAMLALGAVGFAAVGVILSGALLRSRSRDVLVSALLFPIVIPVFLAGAKGTSQLLDPSQPDLAGATFWLQFLAVSDLLYILAGIWAFEPVVTGE